MNSTIVIAIGIILIMALITWALTESARKEARKKKRELIARLEELAKQHNTRVGPSDFMGRKVIALDENKGKIFYVDNSENVIRAEVIDIAEVKDCNIIKSGSKHIHSSKGKVATEEHINRIQLDVNLKTGSPVSLLFYDERKDGILEMLALAKMAEKWKATLQQ